MNIILKNPTSTNLYLIGIWKESDGYVVKTKWLNFVNQVAKLLNMNCIEKFQSLKEAKRRCRVLVKNKENRQGMVEISSSDLPPAVIAHFAPPVDSQMTPEEFLQFIIKVRTERYVTFKDNTGMETFFDKGIQYVGYITDDPNMVEAYDKYGQLRFVLATRLDSIVKTEDCMQAENIVKSS